MAGTVTISGSSSSEPAGQRILGPITIQGSIVVGDTVAQSLNTGDNTIVVPVGTTAVVIIPPPTGGVALTYRTSLNAGDAGLPLSPNQPFLHVFPATEPTSIIINASSGQAALLSAWMW